MPNILYDALHTIIALAIQGLLFLVTGNLWLGAIIASTFFISREYTQAEYRWIEWFGGGLRKNMPWWGPLDPRVWNLHSLVGWIGPLITVIIAIIL